MMCRFRKILIPKHISKHGFTLLEIMAAVAILTVICTTVIVVLDRCMQETLDSELKMQAFEAARENMEQLLGSSSVSETVAFGSLEDNPAIDWQMVVEPFREPVTSKMWIRAVCTASYKDSNGQRQQFELTNWITDLTDAQVRQIMDQTKREKEYIDATGENPFGDDLDGLLKWIKHLIDIGDIEAAKEVEKQIRELYPQALPNNWTPTDPVSDSDPDTDTPTEPDNRPEWQRLLEEGEISFAEAIRMLFEIFQ